jgi:acetyl esterase/lipase
MQPGWTSRTRAQSPWRGFAKSADASRIIRFLQEIFARKPDGPFPALVDGPFPALVDCHGRAWYLSDRTTKPRLRHHAMANAWHRMPMCDLNHITLAKNNI